MCTNCVQIQKQKHNKNTTKPRKKRKCTTRKICRIQKISGASRRAIYRTKCLNRKRRSPTLVPYSKYVKKGVGRLRRCKLMLSGLVLYRAELNCFASLTLRCLGVRLSRQVKNRSFLVSGCGCGRWGGREIQLEIFSLVWLRERCFFGYSWKGSDR